MLMPANTDDRAVVPNLLDTITGKVFGDKGYIGKAIWEQILAKGVKLITPLRQNMEDKLWLQKRHVNDQLKHMCMIEHSRHRKVEKFLVHLVAGLIAYR